MKTKLLLAVLFSFCFHLLSSQVPQGFNYQAIARTSSGDPIIGANIKVKLSILYDTIGFYKFETGTYIWEEEHLNVKTNAFGLFTVVLGDSLAKKVDINCSVASFKEIDWAKTRLYIGTKIANPDVYKVLGAAKLWSVPYSMVSDSTKALLKGSKLSVVSTNDGSMDALFEVKRKDGQTVFAVYPDAVNIYLPRATSKGTKGGFAIGGFDGSKTNPRDYFRVTRDSVRIYIDQTPKTGKGATKGGFAIGGFDGTKSSIAVQDLLTVSNDSVRIYINKNPSIAVPKGATKGGFAIGGFAPGSKGPTQDFLTVSNDSIRMYINDLPTGPGKGATKGGFAIGGFGPAKGANKYLNVETDTTGRIYPSENRILWYPIKNAFLTGRVLIEDHDSVGVNSFASGFETKPVGNYSQALGFGSISRGDYSSAFGYANLSSGKNSLTVGSENVASGLNSYAFGYKCNAKGPYSFALGYQSDALGYYAYSIGFKCKSYGGPSFAFGDKAQAYKWGATAMGWLTKADAEQATSLGNHTIAKSRASLVIGTANDTTVMHSNSGQFWYSDDPVFVIGNGEVQQLYPEEYWDWVAVSRSNAFVVLRNGKTGINMNRPSYWLDVKGRARFVSDGSNTAGHFLTTIAGADRAFIGMSTDDYVGFYGNGGLGWGLLMNLNNGNVGIGTINPQSKLEVLVSGTDRLAGIGINSSQIGGKLITLNQGVAGKLNITAPGTDLVTFDFTTANPKVGILQTSPSYDLDVNGTVAAIAWATTSDIRFKKDLQPITGALNKILALTGITFNWDKSANPELNVDDKNHIGFAAQDIEKILPQVVSTANDNMQTKSVAYGDVVPVLVEAIKEQQQQIELTKHENIQLKSELQLLKEKMEQIEATLVKNGSK